MDVELLIADPSGEKAYLPITEEGIEWSTERRSTPGKLTFKIVKDSIINFQEGAAVRLKVDGKPVFFGFVFSKKRDKDQLSLSPLTISCDTFKTKIPMFMRTRPLPNSFRWWQRTFL